LCGVALHDVVREDYLVLARVNCTVPQYSLVSNIIIQADLALYSKMLESTMIGTVSGVS
jgi:hypothetical protein